MADLVRIANPLPSALEHYELELRQTLARIGVGMNDSGARPVEGEAGALGKIRMLYSALSNARRARDSTDPTMLLWTSMGLIDTLSWSSRRAGNAVVLHDPIPLRKQVGFGRLAKAAAARLAGPHAPVIVSHSRDARFEAESLLPRHRHIQLPHPILTDQGVPVRSAEPTVVVAGQFKPQRDLELLSRLGPALQARGVTGKIFGRGWPAVPGWEVDSRYLTEQELDTVLSSAWAVVIPYQLYFQSGVAIRALELGTPSVSPSNSFADELLDPEAVVQDSRSVPAWLAAVDWCTKNGDAATRGFASYQSRVDSRWREALADDSLIR